MDDKKNSCEALWSRLLRGEENQDQVDQLLAQFHEENALQLNLNSHTLQSSINLPSKDLAGFDFAGLDHQLAMRYAKLKAPPHKPQSTETTPLNKDSSGNSDPGKDSNNSEGEISGIGENAGVLTDEEEEKILGQNLAARFAALKISSPSAEVKTSSSVVEVKISSPSAEVKNSSSSAEIKTSSLVEVKTSSPSVEVRGFDSGTQLGFHGEEPCSDEERVQRLLASVQESLRLAKSGVRVSDEEEEIPDSEVDKIVEWAKDAARLEPDDDDVEEEEEEEEEEDDDVDDDDDDEEAERDEDEGRGRKRDDKK